MAKPLRGDDGSVDIVILRCRREAAASKEDLLAKHPLNPS